MTALRSVTRSGLAAAILLATACTSSPQQMMTNPDVSVPSRDRTVAEAYPSVAELYGGSAGIYRGCGPNGNVCHNARQYPNMNTLGSLIWNVGQPCNQLQDDPTRIDDWCERVGDIVVIGDMPPLQLAYIAQTTPPTDTQGAVWTMVVQGELPPITADTGIQINRVLAGGSFHELLSLDGSQLQPVANNPSAVNIQLSLMDDRIQRTLEQAGLPGDPTAIQFGDPNRNGVYGATIGNLLIYPGHPERSYIIKRLTDPTAGPLMPLANCCFWTKPALRALWCWIASLSPDGSNALAPIDYGVCPDGPIENVQYPDPGPMCMSAGMCPVRAIGPVPDDPSWANIYYNVLSNRCNGGGCHFDSAAGGLDMHSADSAYQNLLMSSPPRVIPGSSSTSLMYMRLTMACTPTRTCLRMPLNADPLPANELDLIDRWIRSGAPQNGTLDAGPPPPTDAGTDVPMGVDARPDVTMDAGQDVSVVDVPMPMDSGVTDTGAADTGPPDAGPADSGVD